MNVLSKILIVAFITISLKSTHASVQDNTVSINTEGIVKVIRKDVLKESEGTGFFVGPHTLVTAFHVIKGIRNWKTQGWKGKVSKHLFIVHPKTKKRIPVHSIQAIDFGHDLVVLHIKKYKSSIFYELFKGSKKSLPSSKVSIFDHRKKSLSQIEGVVSSHHLSEVMSQKTLSIDIRAEGAEGLSGSPIFSIDSKVIGVLLGRMLFGQVVYKMYFSDVQRLKSVLSKPSLNCKTSQCIQDKIYKNSSKEAQYARGFMLLKESENHGSGVKITKEETEYHWFKKSADRGFPPAMYMLARIYFQNQDIVQFEKWMTKAARSSYGLAQMDLGISLLYTESIEKGIGWVQKAMEQGYFLPLGHLSGLVEKKIISKRDYRRYVEDFSERGHPEAQVVQYGYLLSKTRKTKSDIDKAVNLLLQVKEANYPPALYILSQFYERGLYVEKDIEQARNLKEKSIELGHVPIVRQNVLQLMEQGYFLNLDALENRIIEGVISEQEYLHYIEDLADRGHLEAQWKRVYYFISDSHSDKNEIDNAINLIRIIFRRFGYSRALRSLSSLYKYGLHVEQDVEKARRLKEYAINFKHKALESDDVKDGVAKKVTSRVRSSAVGQLVSACGRVFSNLKN